MGPNDNPLAKVEPLMDIWFPSGDVNLFQGNITKAASSSIKNAGGHATNNDAVLRLRLRSLIEQLDQEIFEGKVAAYQSKFKCGES